MSTEDRLTKIIESMGEGGLKELLKRLVKAAVPGFEKLEDCGIFLEKLELLKNLIQLGPGEMMTKAFISAAYPNLFLYETKQGRTFWCYIASFGEPTSIKCLHKQGTPFLIRPQEGIIDDMKGNCWFIVGQEFIQFLKDGDPINE